MAKGKHLEEPPSIEGFVHTSKGKTQVRIQYLLATHDHHLFVIVNNRVETPPTPTDLRAFARSEEQVRAGESIRLRNQIISARGFYDLRDIKEVRRAVHPEAAGKVQPRNASETRRDVPNINVSNDEDSDAEVGEEHLQRTDSDLADEGGDSGMAVAKDKARMKIHRSFEIVLAEGKTIRFEVC